MNPKVTGQFIAQLRKDRGWTQKQLAQQLQITDKAVSRWETGKGYPDLEMLEAIGNEFSVSVNELLCGERTPSPARQHAAQKSVAKAYINIHVKKRHLKIATIALSAAATVLVVMVLSMGLALLPGAIHAVTTVYTTLKGSPDCVISFDYSHITLYGERYVPLLVRHADCRIAHLLISEAQVQGQPVFVKVFFGDRIYAVKGCEENNDIIYLSTEQDGLQTWLYCKEEKLAQYLGISKNTPYDRMAVETAADQGEYFYMTIDSTLETMLREEEKEISPTENAECSWEDGDEWMTVVLMQHDGPFHRYYGELLRKQGEYYWYPWSDPKLHSFTNPNLPDKVYEIDDTYDKALDELFLHK